MFDIAIANEQSLQPVDEGRLRMAVRAILEEEGIARATISLAVVDDAAIHRLNRDFLGHDDATDVLSFVLEAGDAALDGEIVVSADTAADTAARYGWTTADELLLYVIHGALHLVGYDDQGPEAMAEMRLRERHFLSYFGLAPRYDEEAVAFERLAAEV